MSFLGIDFGSLSSQVILTILFAVLALSYLVFAFWPDKKADNFVEFCKTVSVLMFFGFIGLIGKIWNVFKKKDDGEA